MSYVRDPSKPQYYVRMCRGGYWYFVLRMVYDKRMGAMKPLWWPENNIGETTPYLYKTLAKARSAIDRIDAPHIIQCEVKIWNETKELQLD